MQKDSFNINERLSKVHTSFRPVDAMELAEIVISLGKAVHFSSPSRVEGHLKTDIFDKEDGKLVAYYLESKEGVLRYYTCLPAVVKQDEPEVMRAKLKFLEHVFRG